MPSLNNQFFNAMQECIAYGESKRSYREQTGSKKVDKIFSHQSYETIQKDAKDFAKYLKNNGISRANEIRPGHIEGFLGSKSATCNNNTLTRIRGSLHSLGLFCGKRYKSVDPENFVISNSKMPYSSLSDGRKIGRPMPEDTFDRLFKIVKDSDGLKDSRLYKVMALVRHTGVRLDEATSQKLSDFHLDEKGRFGFGYITVSDPKHGRSRDVHIHTRKGKEELLEALSRRGGNKDRYVCSNKDTISNNFAQLKKSFGVSDQTRLQGMHSIRKLYAQDFYSWYREKHTKRETIQATNLQLGHSATRDVSELRTYVMDIY